MRLLLIMPKFFDYPKLIVKELTKMGYDVDFFDDRPSTSGVVKAIIRVKKDLIKKYIENYFNEIMDTVKKKKYDVVFLISGQSLSFTEEMIRELKEIQPQAKFLLYQWDSQKNFPYIKKMHTYFDVCYSFDRTDVESTPALKFLPLFYSERYEIIGEKKQVDYKYDFSFVGTAHPKKYKFINEMSAQLKEVYPNQFIYFFFPSRIVYFYRKLFNVELRNARYDEFHYTPLSGEEMDDLIANSRCILDSAQEGQIGLTIRVIEALGAKKKLITTNQDVKNYDFFKEENIYVYEGMFDFSSKFFTKEYVELDKDVYKKYSLKSWLTEILA